MTAKIIKALAVQQLKTAKKRTIWTLLGISLSVAMLTAVNGFASSAMAYLASENMGINFRERLGFLVIALVLGLVIAVASIIVISNAFRVSAGERVRQFGILKSVGATKAQIRSVIMYEAFYLGLIGIPVGLAVGLAVQFSVLEIINRMLRPIAYIADFSLPFTVSVWALAGAILASFAVVLLSAWLPGYRAAKHPAVSALFHEDDIRVKKIRTLGLSRLLFGIEGHLAAKQMKRSRRNYRATVLSLTISIVLLLATASLRENLLRQWNIMHYDNIDANVVFYSRRSVMDIPPELIRDVTSRMEEFPGAVVRGYSHSLFDTYVNYELETVRIITVAPEVYSRIINEAGVPHGSNVLLNVRNETDVLGITRQTHPFTHLVGANLSLLPSTSFGSFGSRYGSAPPDIFIHGQTHHMPEDILFPSYSILSIIVPDFPIASYYWFVQTNHSTEFMEFLHEIRDEYFFDLGNMSSSINSLDARNSEIRILNNIITLLVYGFSIMLTLIALTNVISTISTNTRIRAREFAVLTSIGMTPRGIKKMLALESIISSARALLFGLPLGALAAYGVYIGTQMDRVRFNFIFPWEITLVCIAGIFIVTFVTTRFSAARLRNESVVETIRRVV